MSRRSEIERLKEQAKKSGKSLRIQLDKKPIGGNPLFGFLPDAPILEIQSMQTLTVGELRQICDRCPNKALSEMKKSHVFGLHDSITVAILQEEYDALCGGGIISAKLEPITEKTDFIT